MLADLYWLADYSTSVLGIPIGFSGGYWARCRFCGSIECVLTLLMRIQLQAGDLQNSMADSSTTVTGIPIQFAGFIMLDVSYTPV